jgi:hypothetical protein
MVRGRKHPPNIEKKVLKAKRYCEAVSEGAFRWRNTDICHREKNIPNMKKNREDKFWGERRNT